MAMHIYVHPDPVYVWLAILYYILDKSCYITWNIKVSGKDVIVRFSSEDPKATLKCQLDRNGLKPCK